MSNILEVKNVKKHFGGLKALDGCTLSIPQGKIIALIGPNGSGKSTLFDVISHLIKKDGGTIYLNKEKIATKFDFEIARSGVARTFQDVRLFRNLTIQDHLEIALATDDELLLKSLFKKKDVDKKRIKGILQMVGLHKNMEVFATDLSYGQRKLLDLAVAIAKPHNLLMLDEPVAGINPQLRKEIKNIIKGLKKAGETILIIEHDMNFVMDLADYIYVLDFGKVIAEGKSKQIQNNKKVLEAYLGE